MINPDILRIMAELHTFTSEDLAAALDVPTGTTGGRLPQWFREGYLVRVKFGHTYVYGLSAKGCRMAEKLPPVDPEERCLLLVRLPTTDRYLYHRGTPVLDTSEDEMGIGETLYCDYCAGELFPDGYCLKCGYAGLG